MNTSQCRPDTMLKLMQTMMVEQQGNESVRVIALHLLSSVAPALQTIAFMIETKEVDFALLGVDPHVIPLRPLGHTRGQPEGCLLPSIQSPWGGG